MDLETLSPYLAPVEENNMSIFRGLQASNHERSVNLSIARIIDNFLDLPCRRIILIGGLPRSGTSSCEAFFHAQEGCFVFDEFHPLKEQGFLSQIGALQNYGEIQLDFWTDSSGYDWRNFSRKDYIDASLATFLYSVAAFTKKEKFKNKDPQKLRVLAIKLPSLEDVYPALRDALNSCGVETHFIYCARDPIKSLRSNFQMPWVGNEGPENFVSQYSKQIQRSVSAMEHIPRSEFTVWTTPNSKGDRSDYASLVGEPLLSWLGKIDSSPTYSDEWPKERRRNREIPDEIVDVFANSEIVQRYRNEFGLR